MRALRFVLCFAAGVVFACGILAVEINGKVAAVRESTIDIRVTSDLLPIAGDKLDVFVEIPGIGKATVASGTITSVEGNIIRGKIEKATGKVRVGQIVTIQSPKPITRPPATVPVLIGRTVGAAKKTVEEAGFQPKIQVGVEAPPRVTPLTVYAQQPAPNTKLAAGGTIVITVYGGDLAAAVASTPDAPGTQAMPANAIASSDPRDNRFPPWPGLTAGQPWLGVSDLLHDDRITLLGVLPDGPAGKAGLQAHDVILSTNGNPLGEYWNSLRVRISSFRAGETVALEIERDGTKQTIDVTLEQIPPDGGVGRIVAAAEAGAGWAMADLAARYLGSYLNWSYVTHDAKTGLDWSKRSNNADCAVGAFRLAQTYFGYNAAFEKDLAKVASLLERARSLADTGAYNGVYNTATERLAALYKSDQGLPRDYAKAASLYRDLADRGVRSGAYYLAEMYKAGQGVAKDDRQALHWYHIAARAGHQSAQTEMGHIAYEGRGVTRNYKTALAWFKLAAKNRSATAMIYLGEIYQHGRGVPQDLHEAVTWYKKAASTALSGTSIGLANRLAGQLVARHGEELGYESVQARHEAIRRYRKAAKWNEFSRQALERLGVSADAVIIAGWGEVLDPDGDCTIREAGGKVTMTIPAGGHDIFMGRLNPAHRYNAPRVWQEIDGDFVAQVKVTADWTIGSPPQGAIGAGLLIWDSERQYLRHERTLFRHSQLGTPHSFVPPLYDRDGSRRTSSKAMGPEYFQGRSVWLRFERRGKTFATSISHDGVSWHDTDSVTSQFPDTVKVGVHALNVSEREFPIEFEDYQLHGIHQYKIGDKVVVLRNGKLAGAGTSVVANVFPGLILTVEGINGTLLRLTNGRPGWLDQTNVIPFGDAAIDRLTRMITARPLDASLYRARGLVRSESRDYDMAIRDLDEAIRLQPSAEHYHGRGSIRWKQNEFDKSIADYTESLALSPNTVTFNNRGQSWLDKKDYANAIADFVESLHLDPKNTFAYLGRSRVWIEKGEFDKAISDLNEARRFDPKFYKPWRELAWLRATCLDDTYRDGNLAVEEATQACELSAWKDASCFNALAGAYAETGDFEKAIQWQAKAVAEIDDRKKKDYQKRLERYRAGKPFREETKD